MSFEQLHLQPIQRVKKIGKKDFVNNYFLPKCPVVIENLIDDWPAYSLWNLNYMTQKAGSKEVPLFDDRPITSKFKFNEPHTTMLLKDYVALLTSEPTNYRIFLYNLLKEVPELQKDYTIPDIGLKFLKGVPYLFFGGSGSKVFMHYDIDYSNIFHFHFQGEKQCILYPPSESRYLYKIPHAIMAHHGIDFNNPNFSQWPALEKAKGYITTLNHGETLYMPEGYWHQMTYVTPGFSMSIRAVTQTPKYFLKGAYNLFFMRYFDNFMRKLKGEQWINYKNEKAIRDTNRKNGFNQ